MGGCGKNIGTHREMVKQESRPFECVLCSVKTGYHAMHPLFDMPGPEGRQLLLPASGAGFKKVQKRLAWVHSLCAQFINVNSNTKSCVYGLYDGGQYEQEEDDQIKDTGGDDHQQKYDIGTKVSKEFNEGTFFGEVVQYHKEEGLYTVIYEDGDEEDLEEDELEDILASRKKPCTNDDRLVTTEAFCINTGGKFGEKFDKIINDSRQLKCRICNSNDRHSLRIPVQCKAFDVNEFQEFKKCHKKEKNVPNSLCTLAMHVGCARWGTSDYAKVKGKALRMCYYYPGQKADFKGDDVLYKDPVCDAFCRVHAREVMERIKDSIKHAGDGDSEEESPQTTVAKIIAEKKKKNRFLEDSDEDD